MAIFLRIIRRKTNIMWENAKILIVNSGSTYNPTEF
jgi:hypothetical protein